MVTIYYWKNPTKQPKVNRSTPAIHANAPHSPGARGLLASDVQNWIDRRNRSSIASRVLRLCQVVGTHCLRPDYRVLSEIYLKELEYIFMLKW